MSETKRITSDIPVELDRELEKYAKKHSKQKMGLIREIIANFLAEKNIHETHLQNYKKFKEEKLETNEKTRNEKTRNKKTN